MWCNICGGPLQSEDHVMCDTCRIIVVNAVAKVSILLGRWISIQINHFDNQYVELKTTITDCRGYCHTFNYRVPYPYFQRDYPDVIKNIEKILNATIRSIMEQLYGIL